MSSTPAPALPALVFQPFEGDIPQKVIEVIGYGADGQVQVRLERSRYAETRTHTRYLRVVTRHRIVSTKYQHTQGGVFYSEPRRVAYTCSCGTVRRGRSVASASSSFDSHVRREQAKAEKNCEAEAKRGTGTGTCDKPLGDHGQCPAADRHI